MTTEGRTAAALRDTEVFDVSTHHHQGIGRLGDGLIATAWADDGLVEAVELTGPAWVVGVQWHPEVDGGDALMRAFLDACRAPATAPAVTIGG